MYSTFPKNHFFKKRRYVHTVVQRCDKLELSFKAPNSYSLFKPLQSTSIPAVNKHLGRRVNLTKKCWVNSNAQGRPWQLS